MSKSKDSLTQNQDNVSMSDTSGWECVEWLLFNARQVKFFSTISWQEQVNFLWNDDEVCFVLDQHAELEFYSKILLKQDSLKYGPFLIV
jgi:hypothetical protein